MLIFYLGISFFVTIFYAQPSAALAQQNIKAMYHDNAKNVLNSVYYEPASPSIITEHEWKEFQLDRLITLLDRTKTSFGHWGLHQLLHPIADHNELMQRKNIITFLIEHEKELSFFQEQLEKIRTVEKSLLAYWDRNDPIDMSAQQFYYSIPGAKEYLNKSNLALNGSVATQMVDAWRGLLVALCLGGVYSEFNKWLLKEENKDFDLLGGIKSGIEEPLKQHSWNLYTAINKPIKGYDYKDYMRAVAMGSWMDRYKVLSEGYLFDAETFKLPKWLSYQSPKSVGLLSKIGAFLGASTQTLLYDYYWGSSLLSVVSHILSMNQTLNQLSNRVVDVATCCNTIKNMNRTIKKYPELENNYTTIDYSDQVEELLKKLSASRFSQKGSYFYSRGHVLSMHKEIKQIKKSLVPLLQAVAFLDAYCSIAQLYKESQQQPVKFSFPEFIPSPEPLFSYDNAWLALLPYKQAVTNNLCLGDNCPGKIIITGPNGGGKSTVLKTFGVCSILAQGWLIVPATHGRQTIFAEIKTGLAPHEDLEQGLSTFMAEKKRMNELFEAMKTSDAHQLNSLVLIDEPYKGTVDAESAKRIYQFGKNVAGFSHVLLAIATHVKKPITLEVDTQGIFGNYQVKINEISLGVFERLFKLEKGPSMWWFENSDQRSRFVDWISTKPGVSD